MLICDWMFVCVRVCVCDCVLFWRGGAHDVKKDTLTNSSLDFSPRQAHGDLEPSTNDCLVTEADITLKTKDRRDEAVSSANTNQFYVRII